MIIGTETVERAGIEIRGDWFGDLPRVTIDTRSLQPGDLFWALEGGQRDGHDFISDAFSRGAKIAAVSDKWAENIPETLRDQTFFVMPDTLAGLQRLAREVRGTIGARVIAVTGSNGKTTTRELIAAALETTGVTGRSPGNFNNHIGVPLTILNLKGDETYLVIEMGANHPGEIRFLCSIVRPEIGVITNIAEAHLEGFGDIEGVARAKAELFEYLNENGIAVVNLDDERVVGAARKNRLRVGFTLDKAPEGWSGAVYAAKVVSLDQWARPTIALEGMTFKMKLPGRHFAPGAVAAYAVAIEAGARPDRVVKAISQVEPLPGRGRIIELSEGIELMDESYNANSASIENALESLVRRPGEKIAILADCLELGEFSEEEHRRIGRLGALDQIERVIFVGPEMIWAAEEAESAGHPGVEHFMHDALEAVAERVINGIRPGSAILVKGSHAMGLERVVKLIAEQLSVRQGANR